MPEQYFQSFKEEKTSHSCEEGKLLLLLGWRSPAMGRNVSFCQRCWEGDTRVPACTWYFTNGASRCYGCCPFVLAPVCALEEASSLITCY